MITYRDFKVILPANMIQEKPYIYLQRSGRYYVEIGDTDIGVLVRLDNFIDGFDKHQENMENKLNEIKAKQKDLQEELAKNVDYDSIIDSLKSKINEIDKELGVEING